MSRPVLGEAFIRHCFADLEPVSFLGKGGFGEVWRVRDGSDEVVLKLLEPDAPARRWRREVEAHRVVRSPRIPNLVDAGEVDWNGAVVRWLTLQHIDGPNVRMLMRDDAWPDPSRLAKFGRGVLQAVRDVHAAGLIFRDVSPGNIVLGSARWEQPFLVDLGLVVAANAPAKARARRAGTRAYKAPEQLRKDPVTAATDLFGVGVVCYKLAAHGAHPFLAAGERLTTIEAQQRIATGPRPLPDAQRFNEPWIRRLLSFDPGDRWAAKAPATESGLD